MQNCGNRCRISANSPSQKEMNHLPAIICQVVVRFWGMYFFVDVDFGNWMCTGDRSVNDSTVQDAPEEII